MKLEKLRQRSVCSAKEVQRKIHRDEVVSRKETQQKRKTSESAQSAKDKEIRRLQGISEFLGRPGRVSWTQTLSGCRLKDFPRTPSTGTLTLRNWDAIHGYIGPPFTHKLMETPLPRGSMDTTVTGRCLKLNSHDKRLSVNSALNYLKLRDEGCSKSEALRFTAKQHCVFDTTQLYDGPPNNRTIKRVNNAAHGVTWNGWQFHAPEYAFNATPNKDTQIDKEFNVICSQFAKFSRKYAISHGEVVGKPSMERKETHKTAEIKEKHVECSAIPEESHLEETPVSTKRENPQGSARKERRARPLKIVIDKPGVLRKTRSKATKSFRGVTYSIDQVIHKHNTKFEIRSLQPAKNRTKMAEEPPTTLPSFVKSTETLSQPILSAAAKSWDQ